jgi:hypothetical protein
MQSSVVSPKFTKGFLDRGCIVMPAKAGIQKSSKFLDSGSHYPPDCDPGLAGMTAELFNGFWNPEKALTLRLTQGCHEKDVRRKD